MYQAQRLVVFFTLFVLCPSARAEVVAIDFGDGIAAQPIEDFYLSRGVTFSNAQWIDPLAPPFDGVDDHIGSSPPLSLAPLMTSGSYVTVIDEASAVVAIFSEPAVSVSVRAMDVGIAGAMMKAYDATEGGNLVASDVEYGPTIGTGNVVTLTVEATDIRRVELFQPQPNGGDGTYFDDLEFDAGCSICTQLGALEGRLSTLESEVQGLEQSLESIQILLQSLDLKVDHLLRRSDR